MTDQPRPPYGEPADPRRADFQAPVVPGAPAAGPSRADDPGSWDDTRTYEPVTAPRTDWSSRAWSDASSSAPAWQPPIDRPQPVRVERPPRRGSVAGPVLLASILSATLASGGTLAALTASGALDRETAPAPSASGQTVADRQPVAIEESSAVISAAEAVSPAVVRIEVQGAGGNVLGGEIPSKGVGSGVIYDANGWIVTNRHVIEGSDELSVELKDGRQYPGRVYGVDTLTDLAIVKIDVREEDDAFPAAEIGDSSELKVGQLVIAIGSPLGTYSNSVTSGIVSATGRWITVEDGTRLDNLIQTDAAINPGNSGGPLIDAAGNVIGINTAVATDSNGIGFAIPINIARPIAQQAVAGKKLARPFIGISYKDVNVQLAQKLDLPVKDGAFIAIVDDNGAVTDEDPVVDGGPAEQAGIEPRDIVVSIEGQPIDAEHPLNAVLTQFAPGQMVTLQILRDGNRQNIQLTLGTRPAAE